jgi:FkbM family methyltransferase
MDLSNLLYRALRRLRLQSLFNWNARLSDSGVAVPLLGDPLGYGLMLYGASWKPDAFRRLARCFPFRTILDVGANEGQTILDLVRADLPPHRIIAFEPNPACSYYLGKLLRLNGWANVQLLPVALSDSARCLVLELAFENDAGATVVPSLRPGIPIAERVVVPCYSLDGLVASGTVTLELPLLMKIDVEGAELEVLRGSKNVLQRLRPLVFCEVLWAHCEQRVDFMQARNSELYSLLRNNNYDLYRFVLAQDQRAVRGLEELCEFPIGIYSHQNAHQCDYLFAPREYSPALRTCFTPAST